MKAAEHDEDAEARFAEIARILQPGIDEANEKRGRLMAFIRATYSTPSAAIVGLIGAVRVLEAAVKRRRGIGAEPLIMVEYLWETIREDEPG